MRHHAECWHWQSRVDLVQFNWYFLPFSSSSTIAAYKMKRVSINKQQHMNADVSALDLIYTAWGSWESIYEGRKWDYCGFFVFLLKIFKFFSLDFKNFYQFFFAQVPKHSITPLDQRKVELFFNFAILNFKHVLLILLDSHYSPSSLFIVDFSAYSYTIINPFFFSTPDGEEVSFG